jgi:hypothetical protein
VLPAPSQPEPVPPRANRLALDSRPERDGPEGGKLFGVDFPKKRREAFEAGDLLPAARTLCEVRLQAFSLTLAYLAVHIGAQDRGTLVAGRFDLHLVISLG